jgi:hypothetical protein
MVLKVDALLEILLLKIEFQIMLILKWVLAIHFK